MNELTKYFDLECTDLNVKFEGPYSLLKWIVEKYGMYNSQVTKFITENQYNISASSSWRKDKVPVRVWNLIHKDLAMLRVMGKIEDKDIKTLEELKEEFDSQPPVMLIFKMDKGDFLWSELQESQD